MSNYRHPGSSTHGVGSARQVCYVASAGAASAGSAAGKLQIDGLVALSRPKNVPKLFKIRDLHHYFVQNLGLVSLSRPKMVQNAELVSLSRPKYWISITILSKDGPTCGISITMLSKMWDYYHYFVRMVLGGTFWIPAAPRRLSRTAAAPYIYKLPINSPSGRKLSKL